MKNKFFSKIIAGLAIAATLGIGQVAQAADTADTIVIIDESGSMGGEQAWVPGMIQSLDARLQAAGVTNNRYGLVGFGKNGGGTLGRSLPVGSGLFGNATDFGTAAGGLVARGTIEDGYSAIDFTLNNYSFRNNAAKNLILITDEDRDNRNSALDFNSILSALNGGNFLLNAVLDNPFSGDGGNDALGIDFNGNAYYADGSGGVTVSGGGLAGDGSGATETDYVPLALQTNAAAWDINQFRRGGLLADSFTQAFVDIKVQEIIADPGNSTDVPEPASILGLGVVAAAGALSASKRKAQQG